MTDQQLKTIIALFSGLQLSIVHLASVISATTTLSREDIAASFEEMADKIPDEVQSREFLQLSVRQVAAGIRSSTADGEWEKVLSRLLH